ncbi:MAG: ABC transporter substrate-binding protein, partial [Rhodobacteraceae bacterium]|nr:ABC transporter substrate-binding protein [Paracoccaceae bacterium]MCY4196088.1 ABC transporter substrate-binding protein [Paracoccaceae bacterium]
MASAGLACLMVPIGVSADGHLADSLTVVSWGGAYQASQIKAYANPYAERHGVEFIWEESAPEAVARLRAMDEANNLTWDVVDAVPSDAIRLCDEGLAEEIDHNAVLAPAPDGTLPTEDFGDLIVSPCFIPQIVYSTTF